MSTYLISTMPADGHVTPARAVAASLTGRGHRVLWHTGERYRGVVEATGAELVPFKRTPGFEDLPADPDEGTSGAAEAVSALKHLLVDRMAGQLADYEAILGSEPVDAVLVDLCALGGRALHERHGVPVATLGISPLSAPAPDIPPFGSGRQPPRTALGRLANAAYWRLGSVFLRGLDRAYDEQRRELGLAKLPRGVHTFDHMLSGQLHLQASTPSLEFPRRRPLRQVTLVGPLLPPTETATNLPAWWPELRAASRVVHVTQGSVATDPALLTRSAMEALADLDALVVVTTPDPAALGATPGNVRASRFVPHGTLLRHATAMVTNAGYNGVKAALGHGVPLVLAPWGNDQPDVAARVTRTGAGIDLHERTPAPEKIRAAVETVLTDPGYRDAARRVQREFEGYDGGTTAAEALERLTAARARG
jgi:UDP:flavonoid glycosyltransferase YjiC (YdhE family)